MHYTNPGKMFSGGQRAWDETQEQAMGALQVGENLTHERPFLGQQSFGLLPCSRKRSGTRGRLTPAVPGITISHSTRI